jgi:plasmid maintenance system antidote protein VapI
MPNEMLRRRASEALTRARMTAAEAAEEMGVHYTTVYNILRGRNVSAETAAAFARAVGADPLEFIRLVDPALATSLEATTVGKGLRRVPDTASSPPAPRRGCIVGYGTVELLGTNPAQWGEEVEFVVETDALSPLYLRGDLLRFQESATASKGEVVIYEADDQERIGQYVGIRDGVLLVSPATAPSIAHPDEVPGGKVRGVFLELIRRPARRKRR